MHGNTSFFWQSWMPITVHARTCMLHTQMIRVWNIYLQNWVIIGVNLGRYSIYGESGIWTRTISREICWFPPSLRNPRSCKKQYLRQPRVSSQRRGRVVTATWTEWFLYHHVLWGDVVLSKLGNTPFVESIWHTVCYLFGTFGDWARLILHCKIMVIVKDWI